MKRVLLFIATNLAVMVVFSIVLSVIFTVTGTDSRSMTGLLIMASVFGMGGAFFSLAISKWMAKRAYRLHMIEQPSNEQERWLYQTVQRLAQQSNIGMPEVAIYDAPDMNAFATGMNRNNALVAVSTGLLRGMTKDEAEAVMAHEVAHVANGDMVTLALVQGVVNTFVIFIARIIAGLVSGVLNNNNQEGSSIASHGTYMIVSLVLEMVFGVLASMIVMWFSRYREFRADAGSANMVGAHKMQAALERLKQSYEPSQKGALVAFGINGGKSLASLFASHPPLDDRIAALNQFK